MTYSRAMIAAALAAIMAGCATRPDPTAALLRDWMALADAIEARERVPVEPVVLQAFLAEVSNQTLADPPWETMGSAMTEDLFNVAAPPGAGFVDCIRIKPEGAVWRLICSAYFDDDRWGEGDAFSDAVYRLLATRAGVPPSPIWKSDNETEWSEASFSNQSAGSEVSLRKRVATGEFGSRLTVNLIVDREIAQPR